MPNLEYHKGQPCLFSPIPCQEGFCSECIICLEQSPQTKPIIKEKEQFVFKKKVNKTQLLRA
jgi:hypothetical protein